MSAILVWFFLYKYVYICVNVQKLNAQKGALIYLFFQEKWWSKWVATWELHSIL